MIEYITLSDLVKKVSQDAVEKGKEIFNTKKRYRRIPQNIVTDF